MINKQMLTIPFPAKFDSTHKGTPWSVDGGKTWHTRGTASEIAVKLALGLPGMKDANTPFDEGCDVPEYSASVKSAGYTLTCKSLNGETIEEQVTDYMNRVAATTFWYIIIKPNSEIIEKYEMDAKTFERFVNRFASFDKTSGKKKQVIRGKRIDNEWIMKWLSVN